MRNETVRLRLALALLGATLSACSGSSIVGVRPFDATISDDTSDASDTPDTPATPDVTIDTPAPDVTPDLPPPMDVCAAQPESSAAACTNGRDDDCDGTTDCRDLGCAVFCVPDAGPDVACVPRGAEDSNAACSNGLDDDCDGFVDCGGVTLPDFGCTMGAAVTVCRDAGPAPDVACVPRGAEDSNAACSNGLDDDCDGYIDCGGVTLPDFGCTMGAAVTVCPRDGGVPRDVDPSCVPRTEDSLAACTNGLDDDCDGFVDCDDRNCSCVGSCRPFRTDCTCRGLENAAAVCRDAVDNDCDGFVDCNDFDCSTNPAITFCPRDAGRD